MKIILLSGGSGQRLWPLSNGARTKQFLKVLRSAGGTKESMVQRVWRQLQEAGLASSTYIATGSSQVDLIRSQLGEYVPLIIEPERRDTFPAIALVSAYLNSIALADKDEIVCVLPVDPYVDTVFFDKVKELEQVLTSTNAEVALIGSKPTYPSEKYGYIVTDPSAEDGLTNSFVIQRFVEKPAEAEAKVLIENGALWNCGVFAFKLNYLLTLLQNKSFPISYQELSRHYGLLPKRSFDYEVLEKAQQLRAVVYESGWKDLGTWNTLTEEMDTNLIGKGLISDDSRNTHVVNELDIMITVLGLSDVIVAAGPNGILVSDKAASPRIKEMMQPIDERLMYEEFGWGWYRILDFIKMDENRETLVKKIVIHRGEQFISELQQGVKSIWTIQAGKGVAIIGGKLQNVGSGDCLEFAASMSSSLAALTELIIVEVQIGRRSE